MTNSGEGFDEELYRQAIGPQLTSYYLQRFQRFARGASPVSWHWPACFVTFYWLLFRKMWAYAAAYFFGNLIVFVLLAILLGALFGGAGVLLAWLLDLVLVFVIVPMYANALYFRAVNQKIAGTRSATSDRAQQLEQIGRAGGTSTAALVISLVFGGTVVPFFGILAAIAIPAYSDFTVRAQVSEGMSIAAASRTAVAETILATGEIPANRLEAGLFEQLPANGRFVSAVTIEDGRVVITYGNEADAVIAGRQLVMTPYLIGNDFSGYQVVWRCGYGLPPDGALQITAYMAGTVAVQYLPAACR